MKYTTEQATPDKVKEIQKLVASKIYEVIEKKYSGYYDLLDTQKEDTAIIIDFNEEALGKKKFAKAITDCVELAYLTIKDNGIHKNNT